MPRFRSSIINTALTKRQPRIVINMTEQQLGEKNHKKDLAVKTKRTKNSKGKYKE